MKLPRFLSSMIFILSISSTTIHAQTPVINPERERILEVFDLITQYHVDKPMGQKLSDSAIKGMLQSLVDPYTTYFTDEEFDSFLNYIEGIYSGIGVAIAIKHGQIVVDDVYEQSPAQRAGILPGDVILEVDGIEAVNEGVLLAIANLQGPEGTRISLKVKGKSDTRTVDLTRKKVQVPVVRAKVLQGQVGYLSLTMFSDEAVSTFKRELSKLESSPIKGLVVDLRNNSGGTLSSALDLSSAFIAEGKIAILRDINHNEELLKVEKGRDWKLPLVVLVNENTASAAELVAAALMDHNKAVVIGTPTYGKGTVQEGFPLETGGTLKLTIQEYFSPNHRVIHNVGVYPNIFVGDPLEQLEAAAFVLQNQNKVVLNPVNGEVRINQNLDQSDTPFAILQEGKWYLAMRKMAYLWNGKVGYDAEERKVALQLGTKYRVYPLGKSSQVLVRKGTAYLQLDEVLQRYDAIQKVTEKDGLILIKKSER